MINLAKAGHIEQPQSKDFLEKVKLSNRTSGLLFAKFMNLGIIERINGQYRISNPLLGYYLKWNR